MWRASAGVRLAVVWRRRAERGSSGGARKGAPRTRDLCTISSLSTGGFGFARLGNDEKFNPWPKRPSGSGWGFHQAMKPARRGRPNRKEREPGREGGAFERKRSEADARASAREDVEAKRSNGRPADPKVARLWEKRRASTTKFLRRGADRKLTGGILGGGRSRKDRTGAIPKGAGLDRAIAGETLAGDRNRSS